MFLLRVCYTVALVVAFVVCTLYVIGLPSESINLIQGLFVQTFVAKEGSTTKDGTKIAQAITERVVQDVVQQTLVTKGDSKIADGLAQDVLAHTSVTRTDSEAIQSNTSRRTTTTAKFNDVSSVPSQSPLVYPRSPNVLTPSSDEVRNCRIGSMSKEEMAFIRAVRRIVDASNVEIWYDIYAKSGGANMGWDHLLPIFHVLPGKIILPVDRSDTQNVLELLQAVGFKQKDIVYLGSGPGSQMSVDTFLRSSSRHVLLTVRSCLAGFRIDRILPDRIYSTQVFEMSHGIDDRHLFEWSLSENTRQSNGRPFPTLVFSQFAEQHCFNDSSLMLKRLEPGKPTMLYLNTLRHGTESGVCSSPGFWCHLPPDCKMKPDPVVLGALEHFSHSYNVIIRMHPLCRKDCRVARTQSPLEYYQQNYPRFIFDDPTHRFTAAGLAKYADVIIAEPSSTTSSLFFGSLLRTPMVFLLANKEKYKCVKSKTINEQMAEIFFPHESSVEELVQAVDRARMKSKSDLSKQIDARRSYNQRFFGNVDGYEEYRLVAKLLNKVLSQVRKTDEKLKSELKQLKEMLGKFTHVNLNESISHLPECDMPCCSECLGKCCPHK